MPTTWKCPECEATKSTKADNYAPWCDECTVQMEKAEEEAVAEPNARYLEVRDEVLKKLDKKKPYHSQFVVPMLTYLNDCDAFFQSDFIDEVTKEANLAKLLDPAKRQKSAGVQCVAQALKCASFATPKVWPEGEKFTFEVPYILNAAGWGLVASAGLFQKKFTELANEVEKGYQYVVIAKQDSNTIGHMILITVAANGQAWISDLQKNATNFGFYKFTVWKSPKPIAAAPEPKAKIDLSTGKVG